VNEAARLAELIESVGVVADRIDNVVHALTLRVLPSIHLEGGRGTLPDILAQLRAALEKAEAQ